MKTFKFFLLVAALLSATANARELTNSNTTEILDTGSNSGSSTQMAKLEPGLYELNDIDSKWSTSHYLLVDNYVNDPDQTMAILFEQDAIEKRRSTAFLYQGRPIKNGSTLMLSPVAVDNSGNMRVQSEASTNAPVIEVISRTGNQRYPFILRGRNGALGGKIMGMRASSKVKPQMLPWPSNGVFAATTGSSVDVMVSGNEISLYSGTLADNTFNLLPMNGKEGKFATLTRSKLDTMSENELADERIQRLATFLNGCFDREVFMLLTPTMNYGEYSMETFSLSQPSFLEFLFPGNRTHPNNNNY